MVRIGRGYIVRSRELDNWVWCKLMTQKYSFKGECLLFCDNIWLFHAMLGKSDWCALNRDGFGERMFSFRSSQRYTGWPML